MTKRVSLTFLLFLVLDFLLIMLFSRIGLFPKFTLGEVMASAMVYAILYLIVLFSCKRKHPIITLLIIIIIIVIMCKVTIIGTIMEIVNKTSILQVLICLIEGIVAINQLDYYQSDNKVE